MRPFRWLSVVIVVVTAGLLGVGWHFSGLILDVPEHEQPRMQFPVLHATDTSVTLPPPPANRQIADTRLTGRFDLRWQDGHGRLGPVLRESPDSIVRGFELRSGSLPESGDSARIDRTIYRTNPREAYGIDYREVQLHGPVGELYAWWIDRASDAAVLLLHGRRPANRSETLRMIPPLVQQGYPVLSLSYRNHGMSTSSPSRFICYGATEWRDVVTGIQFLRRQGIQRIVLYGFSMGGAVALETAEYLRRDTVGVELAGLILDSPLVDPLPVFRRKARIWELPFPDLLTAWAAWIAGLRAGIDWNDLNQRNDAPAVTVPVLLIHGTADEDVPVELSDAFVERVNGPVTYKRLKGVEHTQAWNIYPDRYERWLKQFLRRHVPRGSHSTRDTLRSLMREQAEPGH